MRTETLELAAELIDCLLDIAEAREEVRTEGYKQLRKIRTQHGSLVVQRVVQELRGATDL